MPDTEIRAKGLLTGKMFEYLASGRPILCIGPEDGDASNILNKTKTGITVGFEEKDKMKKVIKDLYEKYLEHGLPSNDSKEINKYSRKALAEEYAKLLEKAMEQNQPKS